MEPESEKNKKPLSLKKGEEATKDAPANKSGEVSRSEPTASATQAPTASATQAPTASATQAPTASATQTPTASATQAPTASATQTPTASATQAPTASATQAPTASATPSIAAPKKPAPKPAASKPAVDPSISVDAEAAPVGTAGVVVDALAAAAAIAFTVLIFQETLPFLK